MNNFSMASYFWQPMESSGDTNIGTLSQIWTMIGSMEWANFISNAYKLLSSLWFQTNVVEIGVLRVIFVKIIASNTFLFHNEKDQLKNNSINFN